MHPFTQRLKAMEMNSDIFSNNSLEKAMILGGYAAPATTAVIGTGDLLLGEQNMLNSGELPVNGVVSNLVPALGGVTGAGIGLAGSYFGAPREQNLLPAPMLNGPDVVDLVPNRRGTFEYREPQGRRMMSTKRAGRGALLGGAIGAMTAAIPAIGYMANDTPRESSLVDSLSNEDKALLNALLSNQGQGI